MKYFTDLFGLLVLTSPLWLIVVLLIVGLWLGVRIAKRFQIPGAKIGVGIATVMLVLAVPFADGIVGRLYFNRLCATQAGVKVYQTVELPAEYWDEAGRARFIKREGSLEFDEALLGNRYARKPSSTLRSSLFQIDRDSYQLLDKQNQAVLGEGINFIYWGGWINRNLSPKVSGTGCSRQQVGYFTDVLKNVFKPTNRK